jgi:hypothetical protein
MQIQEGHEKPEGYNNEEWQAGNPRVMPNMWHKDV